MRTENGAEPVEVNAENMFPRQAAAALLPKHIPFPELPISSELLNELIMSLFVTCAAVMQFISIYRTTWWLPESYTNHTVNIHLIEPYLVLLIVAIMVRRLAYCVLIRLFNIIQANKQQFIYRKALRYGFGSLLLLFLAFCVVKICLRNTYFSFFLLVYPLVVYLLIFGFQIEPFLRSSCEIEGSYFNGLPMHSCSSSPATIREEIDVLKNDFNKRFKQVIFTSVLNAYYAGFVPCFFAVSVYYNVLWVTQHIFFIWLSCFMMCITFIFPSKYCDILHRSSLHLGYWYRLDVRPSGVGPAIFPVAVWSKVVTWANGTVVRYSGQLFRCMGPVTVALPGNSTHSRFYTLFNNPSYIYLVLTVIQATIVISQISLLYFALEWHFILSISFVTLTNQFTFFKIMRDYLITKRIYTAESSLTQKGLNSAQ